MDGAWRLESAATNETGRALVDATRLIVSISLTQAYAMRAASAARCSTSSLGRASPTEAKNSS